jgi:DNA polymerase III sliding clamp (beta) subunit (PCNA family)
MEFNVDLLLFQKALKMVSAVAKAGSEEVDGQVYIEARDPGEVVLLCNNKGSAITHVIKNCEVKVTGAVAVLYTKIGSFLSAFNYFSDGFGSKSVKVKALKNDLSLSVDNIEKNGNSTSHKLKLKLFPPQKISFPSAFSNTLFEINSATLRLALSKVLYAVNPSSVRTFLQGIHITFTPKFIYFVGTDGQKLSEYTTPNTSKFSEGQFTVSFDFVNKLKRIIDGDSIISFYVDSDKIKARFFSTTLHGKLLIGEEYPDYQKAFNNYTNSVNLNKEMLLSSLAPILPSLDGEDHSRLTLHILENKLTIKNDYAIAEYGEDLKLDAEFVIDLNGNFLVQTISAIMDDIITMQFSSDTSALIFDSAQFNNQKSLITPVRRH